MKIAYFVLAGLQACAAEMFMPTDKALAIGFVCISIANFALGVLEWRKESRVLSKKEE